MAQKITIDNIVPKPPALRAFQQPIGFAIAGALAWKAIENAGAWRATLQSDFVRLE